MKEIAKFWETTILFFPKKLRYNSEMIRKCPFLFLRIKEKV
jgi:hypothetical protein